MDLFALHGVNKGAFSHHVVAPHHPSTNKKPRTNSRLRKECECWHPCQVHDGTMERSLERWNDGTMEQWNDGTMQEWCSIMLITMQILEND
jgi:hypothetical protein